MGMSNTANLRAWAQSKAAEHAAAVQSVREWARRPEQPLELLMLGSAVLIPTGIGCGPWDRNRPAINAALAARELFHISEPCWMRQSD